VRRYVHHHEVMLIIETDSVDSGLEFVAVYLKWNLCQQTRKMFFIGIACVTGSVNERYKQVHPIRKQNAFRVRNSTNICSPWKKNVSGRNLFTWVAERMASPEFVG